MVHPRPAAFMDPVILYGGSSSLAGWSADSCGPDGAWSCHSSDTTWKRTTSLLSKYISAAPSPSSAASASSPSSPPFTFHTHVCSRGSLEPEVSQGLLKNGGRESHNSVSSGSSLKGMKMSWKKAVATKCGGVVSFPSLFRDEKGIIECKQTYGRCLPSTDLRFSP